ncbi:uncharacterized protein K444DRAFT_478877, partial [Hyaloscypha bicolor E]
PEFFGLSYCWGTLGHTQTLSVNGSCIKISENLNRGLKELAKLDEYNGQICVNQQDLVERSHQVTMMQRIYQTAVKTLWSLGHSNKDWANSVPWLKVPHPLQRVIQGPSLASLGLPDVTNSAWQELKSILSNDWFSRVWV